MRTVKAGDGGNVVRRNLVLLALLGLAWALAGAAGARQYGEAGRYLDGDRLSRGLALRDARSGVAGTQVSEWRIRRDGSYREWSYVAGARRGEPRTGQLQGPQRVRIAGCLGAEGFHALPGRMGPPPAPNLREITVRFGWRTRRMAMGREQSLAELGREQGEAGRFARIALCILREVGGE